MAVSPHLLTTAQAAARLRVRPETVYAYVSRGLLVAHRRPGTRVSWFDPLDVEALARRAGGRAAAPTVGSGRPLPIVDSELTLVEDGRLYFRGRDAVDLARTATFETAARWLWTGNDGDDTDFPSDDRLVRQLAPLLDAFEGGPLDRLRLAVTVAGATDPERNRLDPEAVVHAGGRLLAVWPDALHRGERHCCAEEPVAVRLWCGLAGARPDAPTRRLVDALLILCLDHDLAMATLAVRAAASARSNPYAAVGAGLAAFDGPAHGGASIAAHRMVFSALEIGPRAAVAALLHAGRHLPGFGHVVYRRRDPRAEALLELAGRVERLQPVLRVVAELRELTAPIPGLIVNIDLALAAVSVGAGLPATTGQALFAVARTAGWIAHAMEEYAAPPGRLRPGARYVGPAPGAPMTAADRPGA